MADDIVTRLRQEHYHVRGDNFRCISCEAADEIERLRQAVNSLCEYTACLLEDRQEAANRYSRLRQAGLELMSWVVVNSTTTQQEHPNYDRVLRAWDEAAHG